MAGVRHSCWRWIAGIGIAFALLSAVAISQAGRFLEGPASAPSPADVVVVLGGESGDRALTAANLFRDGFVPVCWSLFVVCGSWLVIRCSLFYPRTTIHELTMAWGCGQSGQDAC
jgi:hypothetical protein